MSFELKKQNFKVFDSLNLIPNNAKFGIAPLASQLELYINSSIEEDEKFIIIGFSMGGLVSRYYLQNLNGFTNCKALITIGTPHQGSLLAYLFRWKGCVEMRPNSLFLNALNANISKLQNIKLISIWSRFDTTIIPNNSSRLKLAQEFILSFGIHPLLPSNKRVIKIIIENIKTLDFSN